MQKKQHTDKEVATTDLLKKTHHFILTESMHGLQTIQV